MSKPHVPDAHRETRGPAPALQEDARAEALEADLAAFADGKADLAQLLPGRVEPVRSGGLPRLVG